ncbi:hypothetical protein GCM10018781_09770 [Kitasatospora indigofera]|uniref:Uncharacterized protein n=1 Tax=Kitasatospora indigofera TaxID=67307 RepID=A0A919KKP5_9ACTN|nr:hypothetical protein GCM10018781_09770 [Kitasatospora indigofera]
MSPREPTNAGRRCGPAAVRWRTLTIGALVGVCEAEVSGNRQSTEAIPPASARTTKIGRGRCTRVAGDATMEHMGYGARLLTGRRFRSAPGRCRDTLGERESA